MRYLLDVNALVALGLQEHECHERVARWVRSLEGAATGELLTCSMIELGFVRVLAQAPQYAITVAEGRNLLLRLKAASAVRFRFMADNHDISHLPAWVKNPKQAADGHLAQLAKANEAVLTTLDKGIPGAFLIPSAG